MLKKVIKINHPSFPFYLNIGREDGIIAISAFESSTNASNYDSDEEVLSILQELEIILDDQRNGKVVTVAFWCTPYTEDHFIRLLIEHGVTVETVYYFLID